MSPSEVLSSLLQVGPTVTPTAGWIRLMFVVVVLMSVLQKKKMFAVAEVDAFRIITLFLFVFAVADS